MTCPRCQSRIGRAPRRHARRRYVPPPIGICPDPERFPHYLRPLVFSELARFAAEEHALDEADRVLEETLRRCFPPGLL